MDANISQFLRRIGFRATYIGFHRLVHAVALAVENEAYLIGLTTRLYPKIARDFHTSPYNVEHSMRGMINIFWDRGNRKLLEELIGYPLPDKPTVGEFIDVLSGYFRSNESSRGRS